MTVHELVMYLVKLENKGFSDNIVIIKEGYMGINGQELKKDNFDTLSLLPSDPVYITISYNIHRGE